MSRIFFRAALFLFVVSMIGSCTKTTGGKKKPGEGTYSMAIEGSLNVNTTFSGSCDKVSALYYPLDIGYPDMQSITIQGFDGKQGISLILYFNGSLNSTGQFKLGGDIPDDLNMWGKGAYIPDATTVQSALATYITDKNHTGTVSISEYDETNQTLSGTYQFTAQGYNNTAILSGVTAGFTGTFSNVPIIDLTDPAHPKGACYGNSGAQPGGGTGSTNPGMQNTTLSYKNNSFTPMDISVNNVSKTIAPGASVSFQGKANTEAIGTAITSGKTSDGNLVGLKLSWTTDNNFPAAGTQTVNMDVPGTYFYLNVTNNSSHSIQKVYVNYQLADQTLDNISFGSGTFGLGYYKAFSNSNARFESGTYYWSFSTLSFAGTVNQKITLTLNN